MRRRPRHSSFFADHLTERRKKKGGERGREEEQKRKALVKQLDSDIVKVAEAKLKLQDGVVTPAQEAVRAS